MAIAAAASVMMAAPVPTAIPDSRCRQPGVATALNSGQTLPWPYHQDAVIDLALAIIGQPVDPVELVGRHDIREIFARLRAGAPPRELNAFRPAIGSHEPIYVNRDSAVYRSAARHPSGLFLLQLAATIVHEQVHNSDGEHAAYRVQSDFVRSRLHSLPARQQVQAQQYLRALDSRASARGQFERVLRERRWAQSRIAKTDQRQRGRPKIHKDRRSKKAGRVSPSNEGLLRKGATGTRRAYAGRPTRRWLAA